MKIILFAIVLLWLYSYWRFTGKRKYSRKMVMVMENRFMKLRTPQSVLDLACVYMNAQRYKDAYNLFADILNEIPGQSDNIKMNMEFCTKPLPWSRGLKNHNMSYWHNFMLVRFGARRINLMSEEAIFAMDNYDITGRTN